MSDEESDRAVPESAHGRHSRPETGEDRAGLASYLEVLGVISIVLITLEGKPCAANPALETALVEQGTVFQWSNPVVEVSRPLAAETRLLHRLRTRRTSRDTRLTQLTRSSIAQLRV